jgi:gas vesicle protein
MSDDRDGGSAFMAFILGGLTGAALALLYAPRSGRETREMLNEKMREAEERGKELRDQARARGRAMVDEANDYIERGREAVEQRRDRFSAAVEAGRQAYRDERVRAGGGGEQDEV